MRDDRTAGSRIGAVLLCAMLSVLLHVLVVWVLLMMPQQARMVAKPKGQSQHALRYLKVHRGVTRKAPKQQEEKEQPQTQKPENKRAFAKTNPDEAERIPLEAEFVGARNTTAASQAGAEHLRSERLAPAMMGREEDPNPEVLEQKRQDGAIEHEHLVADGRVAGGAPSAPASPAPPPPAPSPAATSSVAVELPAASAVVATPSAPATAQPQPPAPPPSAGKPEGTPGENPLTGEPREARPGESSASVSDPVSTPEGELKLSREHEEPQPDPQEGSHVRQGMVQGRTDATSVQPLTLQPQTFRPQMIQPQTLQPQQRLAPAPQPRSSSGGARNQARMKPVYDPSLPAHAQPGFRTYERRSRSTGTFVIGRTPSLNVEATPRGRYEALLYRLIARSWYRACDEHRGEIIPGSLTIGVSIGRRGSIENLQLYGRRGASVHQQSFTFTAIRQAALPAIPDPVHKEMGCDILEMLITFHFD